MKAWFTRIAIIGVVVVLFAGTARHLGAAQPDDGSTKKAPAAAAAAPSEGKLPAATNPRWPQVRDGHYVQWLGGTWNTRKQDKIWENDGVGILGQRNGTGTYLGEERVSGGMVEFDVKFDAGYLAPEGGGKHFLEIMSWLADRSDRKAIEAKPWSRIEMVNLGDRPRCIVWNYGSHFRGEATKIIPIGPVFAPDRWYHVRFEWTYRKPSGSITIRIDDRAYSSPFEFVADTEGPGRFFILGHVETTRPEGRMHFRNFKVGAAPAAAENDAAPKPSSTPQPSSTPPTL